MRYNTKEKSIDADKTEDGHVVLIGEGASGIQVLEVKIKYEGFDEFTDWGYTVRIIKFTFRKKLAKRSKLMHNY